MDVHGGCDIGKCTFYPMNFRIRKINSQGRDHFTRLFFVSTLTSKCVVELPFRAKFGWITVESFEQLGKTSLAEFGKFFFSNLNFIF